MLLVDFFVIIKSEYLKGKHDFKNEIINEVQEALNANYNDINTAFNFFISQESSTNQQEKKLTFSGFQKGIQALLPSRFDKNELNLLWKTFSENSSSINVNRFQQLFDKQKFTGAQYVTKYFFSLSLNNNLNRTQNFGKTNKVTNFTDKFIPGNTYNTENISKEERQRKLFDKLRQILLASNIPIEKFFKEMDVDKSGDVSNLEFINAIRKLNLGLNLKEIEDLIMYVDSNQDGKISFQEFIRKFAPQ